MPDTFTPLSIIFVGNQKRTVTTDKQNEFDWELTVGSWKWEEVLNVEKPKAKVQLLKQQKHLQVSEGELVVGSSITGSSNGKKEKEKKRKEAPSR